MFCSTFIQYDTAMIKKVRVSCYENGCYRNASFLWLVPDWQFRKDKQRCFGGVYAIPNLIY